MLRATTFAVALLFGLGVVQAAPASAAPPLNATLKNAPQKYTPLKDTTSRYVGSAVSPAYLEEPDYRSVLTREFDSVTPENEMKWGVVEPVRGQYDWTGADALVDYAARNRKTIRGHTLVWHSQLPGWVNDLPAAELRDVLRQHIRTEVGRYRGKIRAWDVVNEAFNEDGSLRQTVFQQKLGDGYIADAFRWAHEADPRAKLYINDYNVEGTSAKGNAMYELARSLRRQGVPIDGVGIQAHLSIQYGFPEGYRENVRRIGALGLDVAITEADVRMPLPADPAKLATQADYFDRLWDGCHAARRCVEFTTWGFSDRHSWVSGTFPGEGAACLFDEDMRPKPAYRAINPRERWS